MQHQISLETPVLKTERLILRAHRASDFDACTAMWSNPAVTRYTIGSPSTPHRTWLRMMSYRGHWEFMQFGYWAVEESASGTYIGELGFADFRRDDQPLISGVPEIGWSLVPEAHGRGYATEALWAAVDWGDDHLESQTTACIIQMDNAPSLRVAEKLGYRTVLRPPTIDNPATILARANPKKPHPRG